MRQAKKSRSQAASCCQLLAMVAVDERGQMVLPKNVREMAGIKAGDKLALVSWEMEGKVACLALLQADRIADLLQGVLGPILGTAERKD